MSQLDTALTWVPLTLTFDLEFEVQIVSREWEALFSWNERDGSRWDALMGNNMEMSQLDTVLTGLPLTVTFDLEFWRSNCISRIGGPIVMERKGWGLMPWYEPQPLCDLEAQDTVRDRGLIRCRRSVDSSSFSYNGLEKFRKECFIWQQGN